MNKLSQQTLLKLQNALTDIENEIGDLCKIKIKHINTSKHDTATVGDINIVIEIYDAINEYTDLDGTYDRCNDFCGKFNNMQVLDYILHKKYIEERFSHLCVYAGYKGNYKAGICRKCNNWKSVNHNVSTSFCLGPGVNDPYTLSGPSYTKCQACEVSWTNCKYYLTHVNYDNLSIYNRTGKLIAKFRLIRYKLNKLSESNINESTEISNINPLSVII